MLWVTTVALAVVVVVLLLVVGDELLRRPKERLARTADLLLALHADTGLALLDQERQRSDVWWVDAPPLTRREIDRTLSTWDLVAALARSGRIEQRLVVEHFSTQVIDVWELAYPYVQHRHEQQPRLWESLSELYLDAFERSRELAAPEPTAPPTPELAAPEPAAEQVAEPEPAADAEALAEPEVIAETTPESTFFAEPPPAPEPAEPVETHQLLIAALRDIPRDIPRDVPAPPAPRSSVGTTEQRPAPASPPARQPQSQSQPVTFEEVVELVANPSTRRD